MSDVRCQKTEGRCQIFEVGSRNVEVGKPKTKIRGQIFEFGSRNAEVGKPKTEVTCQRTDF
jgi:hypothetical protein